MEATSESVLAAVRRMNLQRARAVAAEAAERERNKPKEEKVRRGSLMINNACLILQPSSFPLLDSCAIFVLGVRRRRKQRRRSPQPRERRSSSKTAPNIGVIGLHETSGRTAKEF